MDIEKIDTKLKKLQQLFRVLTDGEEELHLPTAQDIADEDFDEETRNFVYTLLYSLADWADPDREDPRELPDVTISEEDFCVRLFQQMRREQRKQGNAAFRSFLDRTRDDQEHRRRKLECRKQLADSYEVEGCTFQPPSPVPIPDMSLSRAIVRPHGRPPTLAEPSEVVKRLAEPKQRREDAQPREPTSGNKVQQYAEARWMGELRPDRLPEQRRRPKTADSIYGCPVRNISTRGYVQRKSNWNEGLRGGYKSYVMDTSKIERGQRTRLHEVKNKSFAEYSLPAGSYVEPTVQVLREHKYVHGMGLSRNAS